MTDLLYHILHSSILYLFCSLQRHQIHPLGILPKSILSEDDNAYEYLVSLSNNKVPKAPYFLSGDYTLNLCIFTHFLP